MQIQFAIEGEVQLSRVLQGISAACRDWTPALTAAGQDIEDFVVNDVFDTEGEATGSPWQPLSAKYAAEKARDYPGMPILQRTGAMRAGFYSLVDNTNLRFGNAVEYFKYHQSNQPRKVIPRRLMLYLSDNLKAQIVKEFQIQLLDDANLQ